MASFLTAPSVNRDTLFVTLIVALHLEQKILRIKLSENISSTLLLLQLGHLSFTIFPMLRFSYSGGGAGCVGGAGDSRDETI